MSFRSVLILLFTGTVLQTVSAFQNPDARQVLNKANEACKQLKFVEYNSISEQGSFRVEANVIAEKSEVKDVGLGAARMIARGERSMGDDAQPFQFSYNGEEFKIHELGNGELKTIKNPEPRSVGRLLGLYYFNLVSSYLVRDKGLDHLLEDEAVIEYVEQTEVSGRLAHHLKFTRSLSPPGSEKPRKMESSWFFDAESFLPVKRIVGSIVHTTEYLRLERPAGELVFDINARDDYEETSVTGNEPNTEGLPAVGVQLADFDLPDKEAFQKSFADIKGKVTLIDFWGTWCGPCLKAMPKLQALYDQYAADGLQVVGISVLDRPGKAEKFVEKKGYTYQFLFQGDAYAAGLKLNTFPTVFLLDESGKVLHAEKGNRPGITETLERIIKQNLKTNTHD